MNGAYASKLPDEHLPYLQQLQAVFATIEQNYAPLELKRKTIGLDWNALKAKITAEVQAAQNDRDFYFDVAEMFNSLQDSHVSVQLPATYTLSLPLQLAYVEGKFIVNFFSDSRLKKQGCSLQLGDELVAINGKDPREVQKSDPYFYKEGTPLASLSTFAWKISHMSEAGGLPLPEQPQVSVRLTFARGGATQDCKLSYKVSGNPLIGRALDPRLSSPGLNGPTVNNRLAELESGNRPVAQLASAISFQEGPSPGTGPFQLSYGGNSYLGGAGIIGRRPATPPSPRARIVDDLNRLFDLRTNLPAIFGTATDDPAEPGDGVNPAGGNGDSNEGFPIRIGHEKPLFALPESFQEIRPLEVSDHGQVISMKNIFAGTFSHQGRTVGFLRIGAYDPGLSLDSDGGLAALGANLRWIIGTLEARSDYLIIDQTDNPGGVLEYSDMLIQSLVGTLDPAKGLHFQVKPTQAFLQLYAQAISDIEKGMAEGGAGAATGNSANESEKIGSILARLKADYKKIDAAFSSYQAMSDAVSMEDQSAEVIHEMNQALEDSLASASFPSEVTDVISHPQVYTKPIYMLTNQLDFSGADLTPASLQDYGRAKIVGVHTAGAGGTVEAFSNYMMASLDWHMTTSLMVRHDGSYVENKGVTPDISFAYTIDDYKNGFKDTLHRLLDTIGNGTR